MREEETRAFMAWEARVRWSWGVETFEPDLLEPDDTRTFHLFYFRYPGHDEMNVHIVAFVESQNCVNGWVIARMNVHIVAFVDGIGFMSLYTPDVTIFWEDVLFVTDPTALIPNNRLSLKDYRVAPWIPIIRRACWLSNIPLEHHMKPTTHEKIEWIHGLSREEIEAWDLKI